MEFDTFIIAINTPISSSISWIQLKVFSPRKVKLESFTIIKNIKIQAPILDKNHTRVEIESNNDAIEGPISRSNFLQNLRSTIFYMKYLTSTFITTRRSKTSSTLKQDRLQRSPLSSTTVPTSPQYNHLTFLNQEESS